MVSFTAIGVGSALVDLLAHVPESFVADLAGAKGGMELIDESAVDAMLSALPGTPERRPGGSAANTIYGLAMLNQPVTFLGKLGTDERGSFYREAFREEGVDGSRFKQSDAVGTGICMVFITPDSQRTCRTCLGASATLEPAEVTAADFAGCGHVHVEGYMLFNRELGRHILATAHAAGCTVSLDLASFEVVQANKDILHELLTGYVDIVFANEDESRAYCDSDDPREGLEALAACCPVAAVKLGADGAWLHRDGESLRVEANPVTAVDTTGAGDLWAAGFLYGHFHDCPLEACGKMGALLGGEVVARTGPRIPVDAWPAIRRAIAALRP